MDAPLLGQFKLEFGFRDVLTYVAIYFSKTCGNLI
jgi:hypothetical protein